MVLKYLLTRLINNPRVIDKLSESYPIRRAAQLTAYALQKGKVAAQDAVQSEVSKRLNKFQEEFNKELKEGFKEQRKSKKA